MRLVYLASLFFLIPPSVAPQLPCKVGLTVTAPVMSFLSADERNQLTDQWGRNLRSHRYRVSGGGWDGLLQTEDLLNLVKGSSGPVAVSGHVPGLPYRTVKDLTSEQFEASDPEGPVRILTVSIDRSPKRIAFVVENGKRMTPAARQIESAIISDFATTARPDVSFALLTADGPRTVLKFGSTRKELSAVAAALAKPPQPGPRAKGVAEAVIEATRIFGQAHPGDTIFVVALNLEGKRQPRLSEVQAAVTSAGARVVGYQLGWISPPGQLQPEYLCSDPSSFFGCEDTIPRTDWDQLIRLCNSSGGASFFEDTQAKSYSLTNGRLKELLTNAERLYDELAERYMLELDHMGPEVSIGLVPAALEKYPWVQVGRPEILTSCPSVRDSAGR